MTPLHIPHMNCKSLQISWSETQSCFMSLLYLCNNSMLVSFQPSFESTQHSCILDKKSLSERYLQKINNECRRIPYGNFQQTKTTLSVARLLCINDVMINYSALKISHSTRFLFFMDIFKGQNVLDISTPEDETNTLF